VTLAELDRRLARIEELLTAAGLPSLSAAEAPEGDQAGADSPGQSLGSQPELAMLIFLAARQAWIAGSLR